MLETRWKRWAFIISIVVILLAHDVVLYKICAVKMLPFDNKNEFQVVIDMPEGTTLEKTQAVAKDIADYVSKQNMVKNYQVYVGTAAPISFNGLVRHYDLRKGDNVADIQVNLVDKEERNIQSHEIAKSMRARNTSNCKEIQCQCKDGGSSTGPAGTIYHCGRNLRT